MKAILIIVAVCTLGGYVGYRYGFRSESARIDAEVSSKTTIRVPMSRVRESIDAESKSKAIAEGDENLTKAEVLAALEEAASTRNREERERLFEELFSRLAQLDRDAAFERYLTLEQYGSDRRHAMTGLAMGLSEINPAEAFAFLVSHVLENDGDFHYGLYHIFKAWQSRDPVTAKSALDSLQVDRYRMSAINGFFSSGDFDNAAHRNQMLELASTLTVDGDRLRAFPRKHAMGLVVKGYAKGKSLQFMEEWLDTQEFTIEDRSYLEWAVAESQLAENPHKAANWLLERSSEKALPSNLANIVNRWARQQPNACGEWLGTLDVGADADLAIAQFAEIIAKYDRDSAIEWARQISDATKRRQSLELLH